MSARILHVEDNTDDVLLVGMAFRRSGISVPIDVATDGEEAIAMLEASLKTVVPKCVLLDIKLPGKSGLEVLDWIRSHPQLSTLPVIMFTSSLLMEDVNQAYALGANSYLQKPADLDSLCGLSKVIYEYWVQANTPPSLSPVCSAPS